jgi:hypothetical protein
MPHIRVSFVRYDIVHLLEGAFLADMRIAFTDYLLECLSQVPRQRKARFNAHLDDLKSEFDLMDQKILLLRKARDDYKAKGMYSVLMS